MQADLVVCPDISVEAQTNVTEDELLSDDNILVNVVENTFKLDKVKTCEIICKVL